MSRQNRAAAPLQQNTRPYLDSAHIVIIGNGIAGLTAAVEARRLAPDKRIVIITDQLHPTINTPALKQFAVGKLTREQLLAYPPGTERQERIHVVTSRVEAIHANSKYISLTGQRGFGYDSLLIATGSVPNSLPADLPGRNFDGVLTLHRLQDYLDFRRRLPEVSEAVVIGGGAHAIETVMGLLSWGLRVHWLIRGDTFMSNTLDEPASEIVLERIRRSGAIIHTKTEVAGIVGRMGSVVGVITNHSDMIPCQLVLACTGTRAVTTLADNCSVPMRHKRGILVDDQLRTSVRDIYAAGDVAALKNPQTGSYEPRAQWYAAVSQGRVVGAMLAGYDEPEHHSFGVQWHATHLGELSMLTVGDPLLQNERITTLADSGPGSYRRLAIVDDRLVGYLSLGSAQPDSLAIKRIIDEGHSVRNITKALLKGNFDARQYLSQQRSRAAQGILTSGPLPGAAVVPSPVSQVQLLPVTAPLSPAPPTGQTGAIPSVRLAAQEIAHTEPLSRQSIRQAVQPAEPPYVEEVSPFSGNLPELTNVAANEADEINPFTGTLPPVQQPDPFAEEVSPFTGNLPALQGKTPARVVESTLVPFPSPEWQPRRTLWTYADRTPASRSHDRSKERPSTQAPREKRGLWSYGNQDDPTRVEKRR